MSWKRMRFQQKNKVWVKLDEQGHIFLQEDKALIKYQLDQSHQYWIHPDQLRELDESEAQTTKDASAKIALQKQRVKSPRTNQARTDMPPASALPKNAVVIYTDGASSGNPGPAGAGVVLKFGHTVKELSAYLGEATNNIAELTAIQMALQALKRHDLPVYLHTDSSYAIGVLSENWKPKMNVELILVIKNELAKFKRLQFIKVKGHAGDPLNERADELATQSIAQHFSMKHKKE